MKAKTITRNHRTPQMVESEVRALDVLIGRRNEWLNNPINKNRKTYDSVKRDTIDMTFKIKELKEELKELETKQ